jgi:hypothetical protein
VCGRRIGVAFQAHNSRFTVPGMARMQSARRGEAVTRTHDSRAIIRLTISVRIDTIGASAISACVARV